MNQNIFCARKDGATIKDKFVPLRRTSEILATKLERASAKKEAKAKARYRARFFRF